MAIGYETTDFDKRYAALDFAVRVWEARGGSSFSTIEVAQEYYEFLTAEEDVKSSPLEGAHDEYEYNTAAPMPTMDPIHVIANIDQPVYVNGVKVAN